MGSGGVCFVGFDSAWKDRKKQPGSLCAIRLEDDRVSDHIAPTLVSFEDALGFIRRFCTPDAFNLIAFDQPTIVPNMTGCRPVERAVGSLVSWLGGGVQPANRSRSGMFDDGAPVWNFLHALGAIDDPERARGAEAGLFVIEVFPALALASMNNSFFGRLAAPHYNPARQKTFRTEHWKSVSETAQKSAQAFGLELVANWCSEISRIERPRKSDQDCPPSALMRQIGWVEEGRISGSS
jgi:predicted RNase H-like nuclease